MKFQKTSPPPPKVKPFLILLALLISGSIFHGCKRIDSVVEEIKITRESTLFALDEAITNIENAPTDWQFILKDLKDGLVEDVQETVREDIQILITQSIGAAGTQVVCILDAIPGRIIRSLELIRAKLIGGEVSSLPPNICLTSINIIDLNQAISKRNEVVFYGYDFHNRKAFDAYLVKANGSKDRLTDEVAFQSNYQFTVDLSGFSDNRLSGYRSLAIFYSGEEKSRINIQQVNQRPPQTKTVYVTPKTFQFIPPHTRGDREFKGHGPNIRISGYISNNSRQAYVRFYMKAEETKSDWTTAEGISNPHYFYSVPSGWHIKRIDGQISFPNEVNYKDTNTSDDFRSGSLGRYTVVGDTKGKDAGIKTGFTINFTYRIPIVIEED